MYGTTDFEFVSDLDVKTKEQLIDQIRWTEAVRLLNKGGVVKTLEERIARQKQDAENNMNDRQDALDDAVGCDRLSQTTSDEEQKKRWADEATSYRRKADRCQKYAEISLASADALRHNERGSK